MTNINTALGIEPSASDQDINATPGWFSFEGRARRREYWTKTLWISLILIFVALPLIIIPIFIQKCNYDSNYEGIALLCITIGILLSISCWIALWPVTARRLHDRGMSGWWILWFMLLRLIPILGGITDIVQFVIVGCLDGIPGPNEYGPDPKGRNWVQEESPRPIVGIDDNSTNINTAHDAVIEERLLKLENLKNKGLISLTEYETKRNQILSEI